MTIMTKNLREKLQLYKDTGDDHFLQEMAGAIELNSMGFLKWRGVQYGVNFFSITNAGIDALKVNN